MFSKWKDKTNLKFFKVSKLDLRGTALLHIPFLPFLLPFLSFLAALSLFHPQRTESFTWETRCARWQMPPLDSLPSQCLDNTCTLLPTWGSAHGDSCIRLSDPCVIVYAWDIHPPHRTDSFCSRSCLLPILLLPAPASVLLEWSDARLSGLPLPTHHLPPLSLPVSQRGQYRKETQKPFQRKQPLGTESREMGAKSVQPSFITRLGRFAALPRSVRCLSVPLLSVSISLFQPLPPSLSLLSLSADLSRFWTLTYRKGGKEYVREHLLPNEQISALEIIFPKQYQNVKTEHKQNKPSYRGF